MKTNILFFTKFQSKFVEKIKPRLMFSNIFFLENLSVYEIMWENVVESDRPHTTV